MNDRRDSIAWRTAWEWVRKEHEGTLGESDRADLLAWLKADAAHLAAYQDAARTWLLAGLLPDDDTLPTCPVPPAD